MSKINILFMFKIKKKNYCLEGPNFAQFLIRLLIG
jgi:hypothetical protein